MDSQSNDCEVKTMPTKEREQAERLFNENMKLAYHVAGKFGNAFGDFCDVTRDDVEQMCLLGLWKAACKFDASRNVKFSTYAYYAIRGEVIGNFRSLIRHNRPAIRFSSLSAGNADDGDLQPEELPEFTFEADACARIDCEATLKKLPHDVRAILKLRMAGATQKEIARRFHLSQVTVSRIICRTADKYPRDSTLFSGR